jgi:hypothetical protein
MINSNLYSSTVKYTNYTSNIRLEKDLLIEPEMSNMLSHRPASTIILKISSLL